MKDVFIVSDNVISPLGKDTAENFSQLVEGNAGVREQNRPGLADHPFYASLLTEQDGLLAGKEYIYTLFEQLLIASVADALDNTSVNLKNKRTILIISTTKGNIGLIEHAPITAKLKKRVALHTSAKLVAGHFQSANEPLVISNACISGLLGILTGKRLIQSGHYDHAVIVGADLVSKFILSGFESFQAISSSACKPFDVSRNGINLGEAAGTIILSADANLSQGIRITGGSISNDANHISGPSRTGQELSHAIEIALAEAGVRAHAIDLVSAHGTATIYNDEMEALALSLSNLQDVPVNSLKGYYGHTLGAAGIIESIISIHSLKQGLILPSRGFQQNGVSKPLNIATDLKRATLKNCVKTASGFGGCNAALIFNQE